MHTVWINKNIRAGDSEKPQVMLFLLVCSSCCVRNVLCSVSWFVPFLWLFLMSMEFVMFKNSLPPPNFSLMSLRFLNNKPLESLLLIHRFYFHVIAHPHYTELVPTLSILNAFLLLKLRSYLVSRLCPCFFFPSSHWLSS